MTDAGPLLVPLQLDAFVVSKQTDVTIRRPVMDYTEVAKFDNPEPDAFDDIDDKFTADAANRGVYLMWTLPAALRHGVQQKSNSGAFDFPPVPNRWLVVRSLVPASGVTTTAAWIVESDYLDPTSATSPYADPRQKALTPTRIGRRLDLATRRWSEQNSGKTFLQAVGPGDPTFASFQPNNEDVFSIHDKLVDEGIHSGTLHYFVAGWYANSAQDPLAGWKPNGGDEGFAARLDTLGWTALTSPEDTRTATSSLYHGLLLGVAWNDKGSTPKSTPERSALKLALGNTSVDALKAFAKSNGLDDSAAELLEAFALDQVGVVSQPGGDAILQRRLHSSWFASGDGGVRWQIVDRPAPPGQKPLGQKPLGQKPPAPPTDKELGAEQAWLADLNVKQADLDAKRRELASFQRELYEVWWKAGYATNSGRPSGAPTPAQFQTALDPKQPGLAAQVNQHKADVDAAQGKVPRPTPDVVAKDPDAYAKSKGLPAERQLTAGLAPRFFEAHDPVLLISGLEHGLPIDPAVPLACRFKGEALTAAKAPGQTVGLQAPAPPVNADVPAGVEALLQEFALLEAFYASASDAFAGPDPAVAHAGQTTDQAAFAAVSAASAAVLGKLPALPLQSWQQAWLPLYLEWEVTWYPLPYEANRKAQWTFDGQDFAYSGPQKGSPTMQPPKGRTLLTPGLAFSLRSRLEQYLARNPTDQAIQNLASELDRFKDWDFLSQTLDGLMTQLTLRDPKANAAPDASIADLVGDEHHAAPAPQPGSTFEGMRAGQLALTRISIVDRFGQAVDVPLGDQEITPPAIASGLIPHSRVDRDVCAEFPPRLLQGARLRFVPVSPADDTSELDLVADVNPVCGFLAPDHVDKALAAYDGKGALLGELQLVEPDGKDGQVIWTPAPQAGGVTLAGILKSEPLLGHILQAVSSAGAGAFENFLAAIDETLWTIDPLAADADDYLTAIAGRALALVRAKLTLELDGPPVRDPSWSQTFADPPVDPLFVGYDFHVQLGSPADREDGLVGYFVEKAYAPFHVARMPDPDEMVADPNNFVTGADPNDIRLRFAADSAVHVTLLVDPRGEVQAHTGFLPTTVLQVPAAYLASAAHGLSIAFPAGPLLAEAGSAPVMPTPTGSSLVWSWVEVDGTDPQQASFPRSTTAPVLRRPRRRRARASFKSILPEVLNELLSPEDVADAARLQAVAGPRPAAGKRRRRRQGDAQAHLRRGQARRPGPSLRHQRPVPARGRPTALQGPDSPHLRRWRYPGRERPRQGLDATPRQDLRHLHLLPTHRRRPEGGRPRIHLRAVGHPRQPGRRHHDRDRHRNVLPQRRGRLHRPHRNLRGAQVPGGLRKRRVRA